MKTVHTSAIEEFKRAARTFSKDLKPDQTGATVVALSGELGAGKTTFVKEIAKTLGVQESVTSPTFVIEKIYQLQNQKFERLIHIDAYRLNGSHELEVLGWQEIVADPANLILIEWPEKVAELIPKSAIRIKFDIDDERRIITINDSEKSG